MVTIRLCNTAFVVIIFRFCKFTAKLIVLSLDCFVYVIQIVVILTGTTCPEIPTDNGRVSCLLNTTGDRICKVTCDDGFAAPNGEYYTCRNQQWDKDPIQCAGMYQLTLFLFISFQSKIARALIRDSNQLWSTCTINNLVQW